jgi:tetratricopeptide (TPR) repeat protein
MSERNLGVLDDALETWTEAIDAYETAGANDDVARVCVDAAQVVRWRRNRDARRFVERGRRALGTSDSPHLAGLLGVEGILAGNAGRYDDAERLFDEALALASRSKDDRTLGRVLYSKATNHFTFTQHRRVIEAGTASIEYLRRAGDVWNLANVLGFVGQSMGFVGRFDDAAAITEGAKPLAERTGNWIAYVYIDRARAWRHIARHPDPARFDEDGRRDLELGRKLGYDWMCAVGYTRMNHAAFISGRWDDAMKLAFEAADLDVGPLQGHLGRLVLLHGYRGERAEALEAYEQLKTWDAPDGSAAPFGVLDAYLAAVEGLVMLDERDEAARVYSVARAAQEHGDRLFRGWDYRLQHTIAGMAATAAGDHDAAEVYFRDAIELTRTLPFRLEEPEAYRFYARMLIERDASGDRAKARDYIARAAEAYRTLGMTKHLELTHAMSSQIA